MKEINCFFFFNNKTTADWLEFKFNNFFEDNKKNVEVVTTSQFKVLSDVVVNYETISWFEEETTTKKT